MNHSIYACLLTALVALRSAAFGEDDQLNTIQCLKSAAFLAPMDSPEGRKYAPDRQVQMLHLALDVTPDFSARTVQVKTTLRFKPVLKPVQELRLNAVDLKVNSVEATSKLEAYQATDTNLVITFAEPVSPETEVSLTISSFAEPKRGLYFRTPEMGYKPGDTHLFTQGEAIEARHWFPCLDTPNQKCTSEVTCHVPEGMVVISNGRLISQSKEPATGLIAVHWSQEKPHANYLITLVAGYFKKLEDKAGETPLAFYTPPSEIDAAAGSFSTTKDTMEFFNQEIGVLYPWPKYDQVCVNDFVAGGMENTSATTLTDFTLFKPATENIHESESLVSHEMAHQWFGDLVTCKDWSHIWLNEGFATYYQILYNGHKNGRDAMVYELYGLVRQITGISNDVNAIVRRTYDSPDEMFNYLAYPKGGWVLHMLRSQLGEELYRRCIKTYLERYAYGNVVTENLRAVIEELSGRSYDQFFDQWLYHAHHPELEISYSWDERTRLAKLTVRQTQKLVDNVLLFDVPTVVRFKGQFGTLDRPVHITAKEEDFYFPLESAPRSVRFDPELTMLAKITFNVPGPMVEAQLADKTDVIGRLLAIEALGKRTDHESVGKLKRLLNDDLFFGVRIEASRALRSIHTDEALEALLASTQQTDARVRLQVTSDIGGFYRDTAYASTRQALDTEKNPAIESAEIRSLGAYSKPEVHAELIKFLESQSFRNELATAAMAAMRMQDDPSYIEPLQDMLVKRQLDFTGFGFSQGLSALAYLARNEEKKEKVREFLLQYVNHPRQTIKLSSINALGRLGDPQAIAVLEKFATAGKETPERDAAERAVTELRAARKPVDDFKNLRQEVLDLQKANRELKKEFDELRKKLEARPAEPETQPKKKKTPAQAPKH